MMGTALTLWIGMMVISAIAYGVTRGLAVFDRRMEQWPALWAAGLLGCVAVPIFAMVAPPLSLPINLPTPQGFTGSALLKELDGASASPDLIRDSSFWRLETATIAGALIYMAGLLIGLIRLTVGRYRIWQIIHQADRADVAWQDDVLMSAEVTSAMAWTPFGQPRDARIVLPSDYSAAFTDAEILDIVAHERTHLARRDDECGLILRLIVYLCWTSPFAHALFARWSQSTELRCDMSVTRTHSPRMRKAYAQTLVKAVHIAAGRVRQYPAATFSTSRLRNEQMRLSNIMAGTQPSYKRTRDHCVLSLATAAFIAASALGLSATASADAGKAAKASNMVTSDMVTGRLTSKFGPAMDPFEKGKTRNHHGIDIAAAEGTPIYAPATGWIREATTLYNDKPKYGTVVVLETEDGVTTVFTHLADFAVTTGQTVAKGDQIATVGMTGKSTGPHVHIETYRNGTRVDPMTVWTFKN